MTTPDKLQQIAENLVIDYCGQTFSDHTDAITWLKLRTNQALTEANLELVAENEKLVRELHDAIKQCQEAGVGNYRGCFFLGRETESGKLIREKQEAQSELYTLKLRNQELVKDKERLDWLARSTSVESDAVNRNCQASVHLSNRNWLEMLPDAFRTAIDEARKE